MQSSAEHRSRTPSNTKVNHLLIQMYQNHLPWVPAVPATLTRKGFSQGSSTTSSGPHATETWFKISQITYSSLPYPHHKVAKGELFPEHWTMFRTGRVEQTNQGAHQLTSTFKRHSRQRPVWIKLVKFSFVTREPCEQVKDQLFQTEASGRKNVVG